MSRAVSTLPLASAGPVNDQLPVAELGFGEVAYSRVDGLDQRGEHAVRRAAERRLGMAGVIEQAQRLRSAVVVEVSGREACRCMA